MTSKFISQKTGSFNKLFDKLEKDIQKQATEAFEKWKIEPSHVGFKPLGISNGEVWSAQVNSRYRALAKKTKDENGKNAYIWFWIGSHEDYNNVIKKMNHNQNIQANVLKIRNNAYPENLKKETLKRN